MRLTDEVERFNFLLRDDNVPELSFRLPLARVAERDERSAGCVLGRNPLHLGQQRRNAPDSIWALLNLGTQLRFPVALDRGVSELDDSSIFPFLWRSCTVLGQISAVPPLRTAEVPFRWKVPSSFVKSLLCAELSGQRIVRPSK